ncbi:MAG: hypothetical protein IJM90_04995 [Firmicutes bacterium]|nr:hypothetical protein [Bacillota bacterium]
MKTRDNHLGSIIEILILAGLGIAGVVFVIQIILGNFVKSQTQLSWGESYTRISNEWAEGNLVYAISDVRAMNQIADIEAFNKGMFTQDTTLLYEDHGIITSRSYPDYLDEKGYLPRNCYLILIDITIHSTGARNRTKKDGEPPYGFFTEPYYFRADSGFLLLQKREGQKESLRMNPLYYSLKDALEIHPLAFELRPGETIQYTLGFLLGYQDDGLPPDLDWLYVSFDSDEKVILKLLMQDLEA